MRCLQTNSINWTPFYSMASKINTSGSCPIGLCKSLLRRIAQVVGLALDALTLLIQFPISCLCPLKGKVKKLPETGGVSDEKKTEELPSKKVEDPALKDDAKNILPLELNKVKSPASDSSASSMDLELLLKLDTSPEKLSTKTPGKSGQAEPGNSSLEANSSQNLGSLSSKGEDLKLDSEKGEISSPAQKDQHNQDVLSLDSDSFRLLSNPNGYEGSSFENLDELVELESNKGSNPAYFHSELEDLNEFDFKSEKEPEVHSQGRVAHAVKKIEAIAEKGVGKVEEAFEHGVEKVGESVGHKLFEKAKEIVEEKIFDEPQAKNKEVAEEAFSHEKKEKVEELDNESTGLSSLEQASEDSDLSESTSPRGKSPEFHTPPNHTNDGSDIGKDLVELQLPFSPSPAKPTNQANKSGIRVAESSSARKSLDSSKPASNKKKKK